MYQQKEIINQQLCKDNPNLPHSTKQELSKQVQFVKQRQKLHPKTTIVQNQNKQYKYNHKQI